jgi:hypothetical protein
MPPEPAAPSFDSPPAPDAPVLAPAEPVLAVLDELGPPVIVDDVVADDDVVLAEVPPPAPPPS